MRDSDRLKLDQFYSEVQKSAVIQAQIACGSRDEAFDIVQDAMTSLAKSYPDRSNDWPALFHRILQNTLRDYFRKKKVRSILLWWQQHEQASTDEGSHGGDSTLDSLVSASRLTEPDQQVQNRQLSSQLTKALQIIPPRQQQAFILRAWWQLSTDETAKAMNCSSGSVKTHYSRALKQLRPILNELRGVS